MPNTLTNFPRDKTDEWDFRKIEERVAAHMATDESRRVSPTGRTLQRTHEQKVAALAMGYGMGPAKLQEMIKGTQLSANQTDVQLLHTLAREREGVGDLAIARRLEGIACRIQTLDQIYVLLRGDPS